MRASTLRKLQACVQIVSAIAVPTILAIIGWKVQAQVAEQTSQMQATIADQSVRKDFVQIAVGVLTRPPSKDEERLREWAVDLLDKNSPVPFTKQVRQDLIFRNAIAEKGIKPLTPEEAAQFFQSLPLLKQPPEARREESGNATQPKDR